MLKWKRKVRLTISGAGGGAVFEGSQAPEDGFKIDFNVKKTLGSKQNSGTVTIWNLTKSNREKLGEEFKKLTLEVGYEDGGMAVLVEADIRDVEHDKSSPDISSQISFGDGDKGVNKGAVSKTFPKGTKPKEVIQHVVQQMPFCRPAYSADLYRCAGSSCRLSRRSLYPSAKRCCRCLGSSSESLCDYCQYSRSLPGLMYDGGCHGRPTYITWYSRSFCNASLRMGFSDYIGWNRSGVGTFAFADVSRIAARNV
ncbi:hypothetical protein [Methylocella sp. CPCC 101449]|uniref:hypothetical protein n=1 Tax=Methylocella sp. CPCC 101449 TaxID=2987531 RepID=UPI00288CA180|nr:hypothetical protein [Methylocella sp. CPCC 101449]MDT2023025.1 hypothetical protein [Methylocella sp. CPCC 101449]